MTQNLYTQEALRMVLHKLIEEKKTSVPIVSPTLPSPYLSPSAFQETKQTINNNEDIENLKAVIRELVHKQETLKKELAEKERNCTEYTQKITTIQNENSTLRQQLELRTQTQFSQEQIALIRERDHYKQALLEQQKTFHNLEELLKQKENASAHVEEKFLELEKHIQTLQIQLHNVQEEKAQLENTYQQVTKEKITLQHEYTTFDNDFNTLKKTHGLLSENFDKLVQEQRETKDALLAEQLLHTTLQKELIQTQTVVSDLTNIKTRFEEQNIQLESRLKEQKALFDTLNMSVQTLEKELDAHKEYKAELAQHLEVRIEHCMQLEEKNELLEGQALEKNKQIEKFVQDIHQIESRLQNLQEEYAALTHKLLISQEEAQQFRQLVAEQTQSLKRLVQIEERVHASFSYMQKAFSILYPDPDSNHTT